MSISHVSSMGSSFFQLIAKATDPNSKSLAISASDSDLVVRVNDQANGDDLQLWQQIPTRNGEAYGLVNKKRNLCLVRSGPNNGAQLQLADPGQIAQNDLAAWRDDTVQGTFNAINSWQDWEQKINIPGNGPYTDGQQLISWAWSGGAPNELWVPVLDNAVTTLSNIDFSLNNASISDMTPVVAASQIVTNNTGTQQTQTVTLTFTESQAYSFESTSGLRVQESIEFKAGLPLVGESKVAIEVEGTWTYKDGSETTEEKQVSLQVPVTVPANSAMQVDATLLSATLVVPYTATIAQTYTDGTTTSQTASGTFRGVNAYTVVTKYSPAGQVGVAQRRVQFLRRF